MERLQRTSKNAYRTGDVVRIYYEAIPRESPEGFAILMEYIDEKDYEGYVVERWKVMFDNEPSRLYNRQIRRDL